jgi:hypothetical protein
LQIFPEPITKIEQPEPELTDPYLHTRKMIFDNLERQETFWKKRIDASENKTYYLVISLLDSMLWLDINGITVHQAKITHYELSPELLARRSTKAIHAWLQTNFYLQEQWATIPKHPIRTKDISGENVNLDSLDFKPSEVDSTDIFIVFKYNESLVLGIRQTEPVMSENPGLRKQIPSDSSEYLLPTESLDSLTYKALLDSEWVTITTGSSDIIAVYRALDLTSQLIIGI